MRSHADNAPRELVDPDGEGAYVLSDADLSLARASYLLGCPWRELDIEPVAMIPGDDGTWRRVGFRNWRFALWPLSKEPAVFLYCTPAPDHKDREAGR